MLENLMGHLDEGTSGLEMSGGVNHPELDTSTPSVELTPAIRARMEAYVVEKTPARHKYMDAKGRQCIVFYDSRGRAADAPIETLDGGELIRLAKNTGWGPTASPEPSTTPPSMEDRDSPLSAGVGIVASIPILGALPKDDDLSEDLKFALTTIRETFGASAFDGSRAWRVGVTKSSLQELVDTGIVCFEAGSYRVTPRKVVAEGWEGLEEGQRTSPVTDDEMRAVSAIVDEFWFKGFEPFAGKIDSATMTWNVMLDDEKSYRASEKVLKATRSFDMHSRKWRAGSNWFRERDGRIDIPKLITDVKASLAKGRKLKVAFDKLSTLVRSVDKSEWESVDFDIRDAQKGFDVFVKSGDRLVKALNAVN